MQQNERDIIFEDQVIEVGGDTLFTRILNSGAKEGPIVVFLHDALGSVQTWRDFPAELCRALKLNGFLYDRLGSGRSAENPAQREPDYLEKEAVDVLPKVLEHFNFGDVILVGHSDGGTIALIHEARYGMAKGVVSIAGHIMVEEETLKGIRHNAPLLLQNEQLSKLKFYHGAKAEKLVNDWASVWLGESFHNWNICSSLSSINCPLLVIQGLEDEYATADHASAIVNCVGDNAIELMISESGHFPHKDQPGLVINEIADFVKRL